MQREFGGYLPLELPHGQELYTGAGVLRLNCGRAQKRCICPITTATRSMTP